MHPTPYSELNGVLDTMASGIRETLSDDAVGIYLQGSFAMGDFDENSDVDFIVVTREELDASQVDALQALHDRTYDLPSEWAKHLEGSYFPIATIREPTSAGTDLWYLDHGARRLVRSTHCNTLLVRWVVRERGVVLFGPPPTTLIGPIDPAALRSEMRHVLVEWGREILSNPTVYANRFYQGFILLNYCRMLHDLRRGHPGSKRAGAEWAKASFDSSWSALIDRAWTTRPDPARSVREAADPDDFRRTLEFVALAIAETTASDR
jgi:hypothetical protein